MHPASSMTAIQAERLMLLNEFFSKTHFAGQEQQLCLQQYFMLPAHISHESIVIALTLLSQQLPLSTENFFNIINALHRFGKFFYNKNEAVERCLYQYSFESVLSEANAHFIEKLLELGVYPQESALKIFCQMRDINPLVLQYFLDFLSRTHAKHDSFDSASQPLVVIFSLLLQLKMPLTEEVIKFLEKHQAESQYENNLKNLQVWISNLLVGRDCDEISALEQLMTKKSRYYFNALVEKQIHFSAQDLLIAYNAEDSQQSLITKILSLKRSGLAIKPFDIKNYLAELQRPDRFFLETKLLPIFKRYQAIPSIAQVRHLILPQSKIDISQQLESYLAAQTQEMRDFDGPFWRIFCLCMTHQLTYTPTLADFLREFDTISNLLILFIQNKESLGFLLDDTVRDLRLHHAKLREVHSLIVQGYHFDAFELLALVESVHYTDEGLRVVSQIKKAAAAQTMAPFITEWMSNIPYAQKLLQLLLAGFELSPELKSLLKSAGRHEAELAQLLIFFKNKDVAFNHQYLEILHAAQQNAFFLLKGFVNFGLNLSRLKKSEVNCLYIKGFLSHYGASSSKTLVSGFLKHVFTSPLIELASIDLSVYEEAFSLLQGYALSHFAKVSLAVLSHKNPVMLAKACGLLKAEELLSQYTLTILQDADFPEPLAIGFALCRAASVQPSSDEISVLLTQQTTELAKQMAYTLVFFHQNFPDSILNADQLYAIHQSEEEAIYLVRGWLLTQQYQYQEFDTKDDDLMISLGILGDSAINTDLVPELIEGLEDDYLLRQALKDVRQAKILLTEEQYYALEVASQSDAEADDELVIGATNIDDALSHIGSNAQTPWLQQQYHALAAALASPVFPEIQILFKRYATERLFQREDIFVLREHIQLLIDFLIDNPSYIRFFEDIASVYNTGCVNQPVQGLLEMSSWVFVARQPTAPLKLQALGYRYLLEHITAFVEETVTVGDAIKAEAANKLLIDIHHHVRIIKCQKSLWPNIPQKIAYEQLVVDFVGSRDAKNFINRMVSELKNMSDEDFIDYVLSEARSYHHLWGAIIFPNTVEEIQKYFSQKRKILVSVMEMKLDRDMNYKILMRDVDSEGQALLEQIILRSPDEIETTAGQNLSVTERGFYDKAAAFQKANAKSISECAQEVQDLYDAYRLKTVDQIYDELKCLDQATFAAIAEAVTRKTHECFGTVHTVEGVLFSKAGKELYNLHFKTKSDSVSDFGEALSGDFYIESESKKFRK